MAEQLGPCKICAATLSVTYTMKLSCNLNGKIYYNFKYAEFSLGTVKGHLA